MLHLNSPMVLNGIGLGIIQTNIFFLTICKDLWVGSHKSL